jgi:hypothetical protein
MLGNLVINFHKVSVLIYLLNHLEQNLIIVNIKMIEKINK